jgi:carboxymethylenebutenolidase
MWRPAALSLVAWAGTLAGAVAQDFARQALEASPRHHEWLVVEQGARKVHCFVAFPERKEKAPVVLVIHENKGLTDWVRSLADQLAEAGYVAVAPDLLSGLGPEGGKTSDFKSQDEATQALYRLPPAQVTADLSAVADKALQLPASSGKLLVCGFCWGGGQSFRFALERPDLAAAFVFYGPSPGGADLSKVKCPVYGFYAENDARINAALDATAEQMQQAGKTFERVIYAGGGHGFMRAGQDPAGQPGNQQAREQAWKRWRELLAKHSG